jgi:hypothetical protein
MKSWSIRQILVLVLAVFVTVGIGASVVQASTMAAKMTMASDMGVSSHKDCHDCDGGDTGKMKPMVCTVTCVTPVSIAAPHVGPVAITVASVKHVLPRAPLWLGSTSPPDPYPPRNLEIG